MDRALKLDGWDTITLPWVELAQYCGIDTKDLADATIRTLMNARGWYLYKAARKSRNLPEVRRIRMQCHAIFGLWTDEDWKRVRFSDEKHWGAGTQRTPYIRRQPGTRYEPQNLYYDGFQERLRDRPVDDQHPENDDQVSGIPRLHCWGAVGWNFKSRLVWYETESKNGKMNKTLYLEKVLRDEVATWPQTEPLFVLEEDRDSGHGFARTLDPLGILDGSHRPLGKKGGCTVTRWKYNHGLQYYFDPPDSPDLSPIENVWKYVSQKLQALDYLPMNKTMLRDAVQKIWDDLPQEWINLRIIGGIDHEGKKIPSMRDRWEDVRTAEGEPTGY